MIDLKCASFFAGVGGIDLGFTSCSDDAVTYNVVYANEIDSYPIKTYELNFDLKVKHEDIKKVADIPDEIPDFDIMLAGFPCQAFSIAGYRQGFNDEKGRGTLFFELIKIIRAKHPKIVFLENVKNLVSHNNGDTLATILDALRQEGYYFKDPKILNAMDYGNIPQNRERIYIVAFSDKNMCDNFEYPKPIELQKKLSDVIDFTHHVGQKYYYVEGRYKAEIYNGLVEGMKDENAVYQYECFNVQGFPKSFKLPNDLAESRLYKQAGNSVCVTVIERIAEQITLAYKKTYEDIVGGTPMKNL